MFSFRLNSFSSWRSRCWFLLPFSFSPSLIHFFSNAYLKMLNIHIIILRILGALGKNKEFNYVRYMFSLLAWLSPFSLYTFPHRSTWLRNDLVSVLKSVCVCSNLHVCLTHTLYKKAFCCVSSDQTLGGKCLCHPTAASPKAPGFTTC